MSRRWWVAFTTIAAIASAAPASAQDEKASGPPERIDILVTQPSYDEPLEDCEEEQDVGIISGEIVVCRRKPSEEYRLYDKETALRRHAEETAFKGDPKTPDFIRDCHEQGWPVGCVRMGRVPPPAYLIDFAELPETPPGSDADRVAQGLAPRGASAPPPEPSQADLGLPPLPQTGKVNPSGSASPEAEPSG